MGALKGILDIFEEVEVGVDSYLDLMDQNNLQNIEDEYKTIREGLLEAISIHEELIKKHPVEGTEISRRYDHSPLEVNGVSNSWDANFDWKTHFQFNYLYGLLQAQNMIELAFRSYQIKVYDYLRDKYSLKALDFPQYKVEGEEFFCSYSGVVEKAIEHHGGMNFKEVGIKLFKETINKNLKRYIEIKGAVLKLNDFVWYDYWSYTGYRVSYSDKGGIGNLVEALAFFEYGDLNSHNIIGRYVKGYHNDNIDFDKQEFNESYCEKVESIKYFKNRRCDVRFRSEEALEEFISLYSLRV